MDSNAEITIRLPQDVAARVADIAARHGKPDAWVIDRLIAKASQSEIDFLDFIQMGEDDIAAGRTIPHDQVMARLKERWIDRRALDAA